MTLDEFKAEVLRLHPTAQFSIEDGTGKFYGIKGDVTAHTGPDLESEAVGFYCFSVDAYWIDP